MPQKSPRSANGGSGVPQKPAKRARLPVMRQSYRSSRTREQTEAESSATSWITTVSQRENSTGMSYRGTKVLHKGRTPAQMPQTSANDLGSTSHLDNDNTAVDHQAQPMADVQIQSDSAKRKRKREYTTKSKLTHWIALRDSTLDEILRHDGLGSFSGERCSSCNTSQGDFYRCKECGHGTAILCRSCLISNHLDLPLHRVEHWNGRFFDKASLAALGLRIQLGHDGRRCPCPVPGPQWFTVFDVSGAHTVNIDYCDCRSENPEDRRVQLLRMQWFPATSVRPQTAFTFHCLDTFHESTLQGKGNLYDFYNMLLRKTDNANLGTSIYRFPEIHRVFRLWRNLMAWKRAGRGQDPSGIDGTPPGGLTVECPACPHPGKNLPENWKDAGPLLFLYTLFVAIDANFKLKGKARKLDDVDLVPGTGVFVNEVSYQEHLKNHIDEPEMNTCRSEHDAIVRASIRSTPGYAVSGVGLVLCARHSIVRKNGVGDLQKGERYCNMDYIILSALLGVALACIFLTYNIACQYSKYLKKRMTEFPENMRIPESTRIEAAIPSWHINGHGDACRRNFCLGYTKGVGRTCGEEVEITWSHTNPLAASVREMAPAARRDALNDHWNGWNFRKVVGFRTAFAKKFKDAVKFRKKHHLAFTNFTSTLDPELIRVWTAAVEAWEENPSSPNPYQEPTNTITLQDVRAELTQEEALDAAAGKMSLHRVSMSGFLMTGLDLEDQQYKLRVEIASLKKHLTKKTQADCQEKRTALLRRINNWRQAQLVYTPHVANLMAASATTDENGLPRVEMAEDIPLLLPSALPAHVRSTSELSRVLEMETRLRRAAADDTLFEIRRGRRNLTKLWKYKKINVSGTGNRPNTRMLTVYNRVDYKIRRAVDKYRRARAALVTLDPEGSWRASLRELHKEDIRGPGKEINDSKTSAGKYEESWIWLTHRTGLNAREEEQEFNDDMRVEWAKMRARMMRWDKEFLLVQEEMRRVLAWYEWKAAWWESQTLLRTTGSSDILDGVAAYAHKQADVARRMGQRCASDWLVLLQKQHIEPEWASRYTVLPSTSRRRARIDAENGDNAEEIVQEDDSQGVEAEEPSDDEDSEEEEAEDEFDDFDYDD